MSRSRRKTPITGITTAVSEKKDKHIANKKFRRSMKTSLVLKSEADPVFPEMREISDVWTMSKDGKKYFDPKKYPKLLRK